MFFRKSPSIENLSEAAMLASYKDSGNLETLGKLYEPYMEMVFAVAYKYLRDQEESKDAVMQIFEHLIVKLRSHTVENFRTWLYSVTRNHCLMQIRSQKGRNLEDSDLFFMENIIDSHLLGEDEFEIEEKMNGLGPCLETLNAEQKASVSLFYLQEKCYQEIVEITGFELTKVKSYIQNGKRNLKICLEKNNG